MFDMSLAAPTLIFSDFFLSLKSRGRGTVFYPKMAHDLLLKHKAGFIYPEIGLKE